IIFTYNPLPFSSISLTHAVDSARSALVCWALEREQKSVAKGAQKGCYRSGSPVQTQQSLRESRLSLPENTLENRNTMDRYQYDNTRRSVRFAGTRGATIQRFESKGIAEEPQQHEVVLRVPSGSKLLHSAETIANEAGK
ncbi:hypothetical protein HK096_005471, partial [Nowakowskiella sp. JEL0078]